MAEKRMFTQQIIDSDAFLDMPLSAQALYFHMSMRADDDGFVKNPRKIQRMINAGDDDLRLLIAKRFVLIFESGVIVIKHWRLHNTLRKDRYKPTVYQDEFNSLVLRSDGAYTEKDREQLVSNRLPGGCQVVAVMATKENASDDDNDEKSNEIKAVTIGCQDGNQVAPQNRLDKNRLDKNTNKHSTHIEATGASLIDDVCSVLSGVENFSEDDVIDAPVSVQIEHEQLKRMDDIDEKKPLTIAELITACKTFGIKITHTPKIENIVSRQTVNMIVLRECVKAWKGSSKGTGYFVGILENASNDPQTVLPPEKREKPVLSAETISDKQAGYFASRLVKDSSFCTTFGRGHQSFDSFIDQVTTRLHDPEYFKEYEPWMRKLGFIGEKGEGYVQQ